MGMKRLRQVGGLAGSHNMLTEFEKTYRKKEKVCVINVK